MKTTASTILFGCFALSLSAQEPAPAPAPVATPAPAVPATPAPMWAPMAAGQGSRRGWFGISLSCEECFVQRGPGKVAYIQPPAIVSVEPNSPAWQAGMRNGDTIVSVEGLPITRPEGFERFATAQPGQPIRVGLRRAGQDREVTLTPIATSSAATITDFYNSRLRLAQRNSYRAYQSLFRSPLGWLGMAIDCEQCSINSMPRRGSMSFRTPPAVYSVDADGPAHRAGIARGDTLTAIDGVDLTDPAGGRAFAQVEPGQRVTLTVRRNGRERRLTLVAVARPDATQQELQAFDEYKRMRDSSDQQYREVLSTSVARAQQELTELGRQLRELELNRGSVDSSRRRIASIDSVMRMLRNLERQRMGGDAGFGPGAFTYTIAPNVVVTPTPAIVATAPVAVAGRVYPLRYSGRLGTVADVEVRSIGAPVISEVGDSLVIVQVNGVEVKVKKR